MEILAEAVKMAFGPKEILKGIDFSLHNKEFVGIIGPNGSGKSTFLKCVYRVQKPTAGKISFNGTPLDELFTVSQRCSWQWLHSIMCTASTFLYWRLC